MLHVVPHPQEEGALPAPVLHPEPRVQQLDGRGLRRAAAGPLRGLRRHALRQDNILQTAVKVYTKFRGNVTSYTSPSGSAGLSRQPESSGRWAW